MPRANAALYLDMVKGLDRMLDAQSGTWSREAAQKQVIGAITSPFPTAV